MVGRYSFMNSSFKLAYQLFFILILLSISWSISHESSFKWTSFIGIRFERKPNLNNAISKVSFISKFVPSEWNRWKMWRSFLTVLTNQHNIKDEENTHNEEKNSLKEPYELYKRLFSFQNVPTKTPTKHI